MRRLRGGCPYAVLAVSGAVLFGIAAICNSQEKTPAGDAGAPIVVTGAPVPVEGATTLQQAQADAEGEPVISITLAEAITLSLKDNLDIRVAGYTPRMAIGDVDRALSAFDPTATTGLTYASQRPPAREMVTVQHIGPATSVTTTPFNQQATLLSANAGLSVKSLGGGTIGLTTTDARNWSNTTGLMGSGVSSTQKYYASTLGLAVTQPLLRNAGVGFNSSSITIARNNVRISTLTFENTVMDLVLSVDSAYWNLVFSREDLKSKEKSLQAARDFLKNRQIMVETGTIPKTEVTKATAAVAVRQQSVVTAKATVRDAEDRLRVLLDSPRHEILSATRLFPTDKPCVYAVQIDPEASVHQALALRPDIRQRVIALESQGILIARAANQLLPEVDLQATYTLNGIGDSWAGGYNDVFQTGNRSLGAGISLSVPLGNRGARADYMSATYAKLQALAQLASFQRSATYSVKKAVRDIQTSLESIDASRVVVHAAQDELTAETQRFEAGQSIALDVLNAQDALQQAESGFMAAVINFNTAMVNYYRQTGVILQKFGIAVAAPATIEAADDSGTLFP